MPPSAGARPNTARDQHGTAQQKRYAIKQAFKTIAGTTLTG